jgi:hypothetical protein
MAVQKICNASAIRPRSSPKNECPDTAYTALDGNSRRFDSFRTLLVVRAQDNSRRLRTQPTQERKSTMSKEAATHHTKAAEHHEHAAAHHKQAATHHEAGDHEKAAHHAHAAHGHHVQASEHAEEAAKHHVEHHGSK